MWTVVGIEGRKQVRRGSGESVEGGQFAAMNDRRLDQQQMEGGVVAEWCKNERGSASAWTWMGVGNGLEMGSALRRSSVVFVGRGTDGRTGTRSRDCETDRESTGLH